MIYFFDDIAIVSSDDLTPTPAPVERLGCVLEPDLPSDGKRTMSFASSLVPLDDGRWRLYYSVSDFDAKMRGMALAESEDGLTWHKPDFGQLQGTGPSNRLRIGGLAPGVENYSQPQIVRRDDGGWRMFFWVNHRPYLRYCVADSDDGLTWEVADFERPAIYHPLELGSWIWTAGIAPPVVEHDSGPNQEALAKFVPGEQAVWGHLLEKLDEPALIQLKGLRANDAVYVYRDDDGHYELYAPWPMCNPEGSPRRAEDDNAPFMLRAMHRRTSEDGYSWSDAELLISPDEQDDLDQQFYYLAVHRQDGWHIGMLGSYPVTAKTMDIELCFSRDGRRWERPIRTPWIPREDEEETGMIHAPNRVVDSGEHWLLLYTASPHRHGLRSDTERATVRAARFPKNRFLGLSTEKTGCLQTKPFVLGGTELYIDARVDGSLRAELCDPFGTPIPGFELGKFEAVSGDNTSHPLSWDGVSPVNYRYNAVSLKIVVERGSLFNIHWR